jgi:hypothetical protein
MCGIDVRTITYFLLFKIILSKKNPTEVGLGYTKFDILFIHNIESNFKAKTHFSS